MNKGKSVDSNGKPLLKNRELTKPPMIMKDKTKYCRKDKYNGNKL